VAAEHQHHGAPAARRGGDRVHDEAEVARDQDVGEGAEEGAEGAVGAGRVREFRRADLARPAGYGDGAEAREIRFRDA